MKSDPSLDQPFAAPYAPDDGRMAARLLGTSALSAKQNTRIDRTATGLIEAIRAEGTSPWYSNAHDEAVLVMDGEVEVHLLQPDRPLVPEGKEGSVQLQGEPTGKKMGWVKATRGHMTLLPKGAAYQFRSAKPGVLLQQTIKGDFTIERWAEICQTTA